jgi:hypothetical protein
MVWESKRKRLHDFGKRHIAGSKLIAGVVNIRQSRHAFDLDRCRETDLLADVPEGLVQLTEKVLAHLSNLR